jgi:DNA-binding MarR family transcriptional regulator
MAENANNKPEVSSGDPDGPGRFAYDGLERVMHEKARLGILTSLVAHPDGLLFNDLKDLCSLTDGNLSRHLQMLQDAQLVEVWKGVRKNRPQTLVRLTDAGRKRFMDYISVLESVVADAAVAREAVSRATSRPADGRAAAARLPLPKGISPA